VNFVRSRPARPLARVIAEKTIRGWNVSLGGPVETTPRNQGRIFESSSRRHFNALPARFSQADGQWVASPTTLCAS